MNASVNSRKFVYRILIAFLKGGPGKTTTTAMLALALAAQGLSVLAICADPASQGLTDWYEIAKAGGPVPIVVLPWRGTDADGELSAFARKAEEEHQPDVVLIDTGGERRDIVMAALLYADRVISPCSDGRGEIRRLPATRDLVASFAGQRGEIPHSVLITRVPKAATRRLRGARAAISSIDPTPELAEQYGLAEPIGVHVMDAVIPFKGDYSEAWGSDGGEGGVALGEYVVLGQEVYLEYIEAREDAAQ